MGDVAAEPITARDDALHEHGGAPGWRERLTFTFFDAAAGLGGVGRMLLSPVEAKAEATLNVFLPDRSLATVLLKGPFDRACTVGRLAFKLDEPLRMWHLRCRDTALVLHGVGPGGLPSGRDRSGAAARIELDLRFEAWTEAFGALERARVVDEMNFVQVVSTGSFEQAGRVAGTLRVGGHQATLDAGGVRERAWGTAVERDPGWWLAAAFGPTASLSLRASGGWAVLDGEVHALDPVELVSEAEGRTVRRVRIPIGDDVLEGEVRATIPIRDGGARIQQSLADYRLGERRAWGLAELADPGG